MSNEYRRFEVKCQTPVERERLLAEAFEAGAEGAEEREQAANFVACLYVPVGGVEGVRECLRELADPTTEIGEAEPLPEVDWSEAWKEGLEALVISPRLVVRPPFAPVELARGQREIVIEPGQAFGTGAHASTQLCLIWMDRLIAGSRQPGGPPDRVLDVGTGSGVLALSAIALGARRAIGFDLDPVAIEAAREAAEVNRIGKAVEFFAGSIEALRPSEPPFPLVVVNLLKREMLPIATEIAQRLLPGGHLVLAGLLEEDIAEVEARFGEEGLVRVDAIQEEDGIGVWVGLCLVRPN